MLDPSPQGGGTINLRGRRLLVVGLAREGTALARYLAGQGARVAATDLKPLEAFGGELAPLVEAGVPLTLGDHPSSLLDGCEVMFVSPGVPFDAPFLAEARAQGVPLSTESRLFCQLCPAPIAAVTGSSGKTTTITLVGEMLKADKRTTWVGGNIGQPLIERLDQIRPDDNVAVELSSFQLEYYHPSANDHVTNCDPLWLPLLAGWSPAVGAILNITPNHLDRHPSLQAYIHAKRALVAYRRPGDVAVLGLDDDATRAMGQELAGRVRWFSRASAVDDGASLSGVGRAAALVLRSNGHEQVVCQVGDIRLRGDHNVSNVLAACAVADALGVAVEAMRHVITTFAGVEHRLELVAEVRGVRYYNDSIATSPERLIAALKSFDEPIVLLAGGRDKHLPWEEAAHLMLERARDVVLFGEAVELIARALEAAAGERGAAGRPMLHRCVTLADAVAVATQVAHPGDVVLLAPGCTSFDAFKDFAERGERFRELVRQVA
jgi:UDP-N-acetylmuramoylalanine--D-glutamate ligase